MIVAVLAFKAVYTLETTRQENDRRVMTLYVEMKEMMMVIVEYVSHQRRRAWHNPPLTFKLRLKDVEKVVFRAPDGSEMEGQLEKAAGAIAKDIEECANFCDMFLKKHVVVKVMNGLMWKDKFVNFLDTFARRKAEFERALAIRTVNSNTEIKKSLIEIDKKCARIAGFGVNRFVDRLSAGSTFSVNSSIASEQLRNATSLRKSSKRVVRRKLARVTSSWSP